MPPADQTQPQGSPLLEVILALLTPIFLPAAGNNEARARYAAQHALAGLGPLPFRDLLAHAQAIALTVGSLASLAEANAPDLPPATAVRFRANGHALAKSAERIRRTLNQKDRQPAPAPRQTAPVPKTAWSDAFTGLAQDFAPIRSAADTQQQDAILRAALASAAQALGGTPPRQPT